LTNSNSKMETKIKTLFLCAGIILTILVLAAGVKAETNIGGYINTDNRYRPEGNDQYTWNENRLGLKITASADGVSGFSELRFRNFGFPDIQQTGQLRDSDYIQPWRFELYEAYVDIYGLLFENLDIRVGKQRIAWGTADKLNVVDNLNPDDFEDILDFSQKIPTMSLRLDYYPGDFIVTGVIVPAFTPARSMPSSWQTPVSFPLPPELSLRTLDDEVILPENRPQDSAILGLRIKRTLLDYDWSLSYVYGRDEWALPTKAEIITIDTLDIADVHLTLEYPRLQIIGADMAGAIGDIGIWAEGAVFLPEKKVYTSITSPDGTQEQLALDDKPYLKYVVGGDYTFKNGIYVNGQYLHGFYTDRGVDNMEDYFLIAFEKKFFHEDLKTRIVIAAEVADFDDIENRSAYFGGPELTYYPKDNIELVAGSFLLAGDSSTQFGQFKENDEIYFKVKYSF